MLPDIINHQHHLLTVNRHHEAMVVDTLPGVSVAPLFLDAENGLWVLYAKFTAGTVLPKHFHTGTVHFYTTAGAWCYLEYPDDVQTEGSYLYEPGGSIHTFSSPEGAEGFMVVNGANVNFDDDGNFVNVMDAGWIEAMMVAACAAQQRPVPKYIRPSGPAGFSATPAPATPGAAQ